MRVKLDPQSPSEFLARHWQKCPRYIPSAFDTSAPQLESGELAWLAMQQDVEARLVFTDRSADPPRYSLEEGPFDEQRLTGLPPQDWTLLVQDVEKHLPEFRQWLAAIPFIPDWRIDDLMVSFAASGGSVGPHLDNYDVFLCQGEGSREWRLGDPATAVAAPADSGLSLLRPFGAATTYTCTAGDVLYLPPGNPHWGVATEPCVTYSIGLRAPESRELELTIERLFPDAHCRVGEADRALYEDPDLVADESMPGEISVSAIARARRCFPFADALDRTSFVCAFGCTVTDPKAWLAPEGITLNDVADLTTRSSAVPLEVHGMAKLAWSRSDRGALVFVNGMSINASQDELSMFRQLCERRQMSGRAAARLVACGPDSSSGQFLAKLLEYGAFDPESLIPSA